MDPKKEKRVIILGGGFGGVITALTLAKKKIPNLSITLVDKNEFHAYPADYYEIATAFTGNSPEEDRNDFVKLRASSAILFKDIVQGTSVAFTHGRVTSVDFKARFVSLEDEKKLPYDYLVIALGSSTNFMGIPHLEEYALELKSLEDALNVRASIEELFLSRPKKDIIRIVIGGGGFTGCELAGELVGYIKKLSRLHGHPSMNVECSLVEASGNLLGKSSLWVQQKALERLRGIGIKVLLNTPIADISAREVSLKDGRKLPYSLLVWTAGIQPNLIAQSLPSTVAQKKSYLAVDEALRLKSHKNIYAIGDIAWCDDASGNDRVPATAYMAISEGEHIAENIARREGGKEESAYKPPTPKYIIPLGGKYVLADLGGLRFSGGLAWVLKRLVALRYFAKILPWSRAWALWKGDMKLYTQNDE